MNAIPAILICSSESSNSRLVSRELCQEAHTEPALSTNQRKRAIAVKSRYRAKFQ